MPSISSTKPCAPGIHDVGLAQRLELERGALQRAAGRRDAAPQQRAEVAHALVLHAVHLVREVGEHGEDRALARLAQAVARIVGAAAHAVGELVRAEIAEMAEPVAESEEELREDGAGVAARAVERGVRDARQGLAGVVVRRARQAAEHRAHGEREVRARVAVRHREDVDLVEVLLPRQQARDAGLERVLEAQSVEALGDHRCGVQAPAPRPQSRGSRKRLPPELMITPSGVISSIARALGGRVALAVAVRR